MRNFSFNKNNSNINISIFSEEENNSISISNLFNESFYITITSKIDPGIIL